MHRSRPDPAAIATPPTGTPGVLINGADFGFDRGAGPDLTISQRINNSWLWEARYFDNRTTQIAGGTNSPVGFGRVWYNGVTCGIDHVW